MSLYIKEWSDNTATLITESGRVIWTFVSVEKAEEAAEDFDEIMNFQETKPEPKKCTLIAVA